MKKFLIVCGVALIAVSLFAAGASIFNLHANFYIPFYIPLVAGATCIGFAFKDA